MAKYVSTNLKNEKIMKKSSKIFSGLTLLLLAISQASFGQSLGNLKLDNRLSILNDKAFFKFPTAAKNEVRETDIMSADHNINKETRIVLDIDDMRLVFFAQELYRIGDKNLFAEVSKEKGSLNFNRKILTDQGQLLSILSTPTVFDSTRNAILVNSLLVKTQDNSIFQINAYINPDAYRQKDEFVKLTEQVFQTLTKGTRENNLAQREETLNIFGTKKGFKFSIPEKYTITIDQKYDFQVFKFNKYSNLNDTDWVRLTIYTGNHPSYFYKSYELDEKSSKRVTGKFLDSKVDWLTFYDSDKQIFLKEQIIPSDKIDKGLLVHIAMVSNKDISIEELTKIVESIQLK
jgi:hypothetical protein